MIKDYLHPLWGKSIRGLSYPDGKANDAFIDSLQQNIDTGEKDMYLAKLSAFLDTATGKWLDYWGEWLGLHRNQRSDDEYRSALKAHVLHSRNTIDAIRDAVAKYLDTNRSRIYVYEPYRDMFIYNSSKWNTYKFYPSVYYRYAVIDVKIDHPIDGVVAQIINLFRPAGVIFVITNLINVLNDKAPIIDFSLDASSNFISKDIDYVGFTQNNSVVLSPSLDASFDNGDEPFTYGKDLWNGGKKYASGSYGSGLLQYASMFQTDQHIHSYPENLLDYSTLTPTYQAQVDINVKYDTGIAKNADITVTCGTNDNSKTSWGDGFCFNSKSFGQDKNVPWGKWFVISGLIKADFNGAELVIDFNTFPYGKYEFGVGNDHDDTSKRVQVVFNGNGDNSTLVKGVWTPFYLAWYNGTSANPIGNPEHAVMYDSTQINVKNTQGVSNAQYHVKDLYYRVVDSPDTNEVWVPGSYSTLFYDSPKDKTSAGYAKQGLYDSVDARYAKYSKVNTNPVIGYVDFLSAYSATKFNKFNIDYSGYTGTQTEKLVQALKQLPIKSLSVYAKVARNSADVTLRVFNYKLSLWEIFGTYTLTSNDYMYITHNFYDLSSYVNPVTGLLTFSLVSNNDLDLYVDYYSFAIGSKIDGVYELSTEQFYDNVPLGALTSYDKVSFTDAHYPVTGTAVTNKDSLYRVKTLRAVWDSNSNLQGSGLDFKVGIPELHHTGKNSSQSDSYMVVTYTSDNGAIAPFSSAKLGSINFDLSTANVNLSWTNNVGGVRNLVAQSDLTGGYINRDNGEITYVPTADFHVDKYIPTNGATVFTFSSPDYVFKGSSDSCIAMYDYDKKYLGNQTITTATQTLSNPNTAYIRFSINFVHEGGTMGELSDWLGTHRYMLEEGSVAHDWQPAPEDLGANRYVCIYRMPLYEDNNQSADLFATLADSDINIERVQVMSYFDSEVLNKKAHNYHMEPVHYNNIGSSGTVFGGIDKDNEMYIRVKSSVPNVFGVGPYYLPGFDSESESKYATVSADVSGTGYLTRAVLEDNTPPVGYYNLVKFSTRDIFVTAKGDSAFVWIAPEIFPMTNGETYTFSFTPSCAGVGSGDTSDISKFSVRILDTKTTGKEVASLVDTADGKRHSLTFTIPNDGDNYGLYIYAGKWGSSLVGSSYFTTIYHHTMLEKGSVAHDWSPNPMYVGLKLNSDGYTSISNTFNPVVSNSNPYTLYLSDYFAKYTNSNNLLKDSPTDMVYEKHTNGSGWLSSKSWKLTLNKGNYWYIGYLSNDDTKASADGYTIRIDADTSSGITLLSSGENDISTAGYMFGGIKHVGESGWVLLCFTVPKDNTQVTLYPWCSIHNTNEGRIGYSHLGLYSADSFYHDLYMDNGFINPPLLDYKYKNMKTEYGVVATKPTDRSVHESLNINTDVTWNNNSYWNNLSSFTKAGIKDPNGDTPVYTTSLNKGLSTTGYMLEPNTWYKVSTWAKLPNNTDRRLAWTFYNSGFMSVWDSNTNEYSQDNMRFGGVNLLPNTDSGNVSTDGGAISYSQWVLGSNGTATMSVVEETANKNVGKYSYTMLANNNGGNKDLGIIYPFKANTTYTATCKVRLNSNSTNAYPILHIRAWDSVGSYDEAGDSMLYQGSPKLYKDRWVTISATFSTSSWKNVSNKHNLEFGIQGPGCVDFYEFQLEEGSVAHPYSPAPGDYGLASNQYLVATDSKDWFRTSALFYTGSGFDTHIPELQMINGSGTLYQGPIFINKIKQNGENLLPSFRQIVESNDYSQRTFNEVWNVIKNNNDSAYTQSSTNSDADTLFLKGGSELYINTATTANINSQLGIGVINNTGRDVSLVISYVGDSQTYVIKANTSRDINRSFIANGNGYSILSFKADGDLTFTSPSMTI